jgi:hypothetical protein
VGGLDEGRLGSLLDANDEALRTMQLSRINETRTQVKAERDRLVVALEARR